MAYGVNDTGAPLRVRSLPTPFKRRAPHGHLQRLIATLPLLLLMGTSAIPAAAAPSEAMQAQLDARIEAQPLGDALRALARAANVQILFDAKLVADLQSPSLQGPLSLRAALDELLRGSQLEAFELAPGIIGLRRVSTPSAASSASSSVRSRPLASTSTSEITPLGELLVTAQRRAERPQDVPISLSVYDVSAMDVQGSKTIDDIARMTPGIDFERGLNYNSESSNISIRGIASAAGTATTGVYIDDTPIQGRQLSFGTFNAYPQLFDLDRVEVLRGPQGTLFGSGSEGGTMRFITPTPDLHAASVYVRTEGGWIDHGAGLAEMGAAGGVPLVDDTLAIRLSASYRYEGGYVDRIDWHTRDTIDPNSNANTTRTARVALKWAARANLILEPSIYYQDRHLDDTAAWWSPVPGTPDPTGNQFDSPFRNGNAIMNPSTDAFSLSALKINWNAASVRLFSSTSYFKRDQTAVSDYTEYDRAVLLGNPYPPPGVQAPTFWAVDQSYWTQELRIESNDTTLRTKWTAGIFYQHAYESTIENVFDPALVRQLRLPVYKGGYLYYQEPFGGIDSQTAGFGQADLRASDALSLTLGLRYGRSGYSGYAYYAGPVVGAPVSSTGRIAEYPVTPKAGLEYRVDPTTLLYTTMAKGYRIGGVNPAVGRYCYGGPDSPLGSIGLAQVPPQYHSDDVWSYEIGDKSAFQDGRALLDVSAYLIRWNGIQQNVQLTGCGFQFTANLGAAESKGFDVQGEIKVGSVLLGGTLDVSDARYTQTVRLPSASLSVVQDGDHIPGSPWKAQIFAQADFPLLARQGYTRIDFEYAAALTNPVPGRNPLDGGYGLWTAGVPAQSYTSLRAGMKWGGYDLSLFAQNLFDTQPRLTVNQDVASPTGGTPLLYVITWRPRTLGLTLTYHY